MLTGAGRPLRPAGQRRHHGAGQRHACGRTVLGHCALGHMNVQIIILVEVGLNADFLGFGSDVGKRSARRFLHDVAQTAGEIHRALSGHDSHLDGHGGAAHLRPRKAVDNAHLGLLERHVRRELAHAQIVGKMLGLHGNGLGLEVAWNRGRLDTTNQLLGVNLFNERDKPTNGEFISLIAEKAAGE